MQNCLRWRINTQIEHAPFWEEEFVREGAQSELLYADYLVLISETIEGLRNKFLKWSEAFVSKGLKVNLGKTKVMVSGDISNDVNLSHVEYAA